MADNKQYELGERFRAWLIQFFTNKDTQDYMQSKYGITPMEMPTYGSWGDYNDEFEGWSFNITKSGDIKSVVISGQEIFLEEIPGYEEGFEQPLGGRGFWAGLFGLPEEWSSYDVEALDDNTVNKVPETYGPSTVATGEIQEEMDAIEAADPEFQALTEEEEVEPEDPASKFYTYEDFEKNTLTPEQWEQYVEAIKQGSLPAEAWGYVTGDDPANFDYVYTWDGEKNKPAYLLDEDYGPIPIPIAAQPQEKVLSKRFMSRLHNQFSPDQVEALKDVLIMSGVAEDGDFSGVGTVDRSLELIMENVLNMANTNYGHIAYKSDDYFKLVENASNLFGDNMPVGLSEQEKFEWGLVGVVLSQYGATQEKSAELAGIEAAKQAKLASPLPSKETMASDIKRWIKDAIGADATPEQIQEYTDYWISQETEWGKQIAYANKVAQVGMDIEHYHIKSGKTLSMEEVKAMEKEIGAGGDVLTGIVGTREKVPTVTDPQLATYNLISSDLAGEKEIIEAGKKKRAKQSGILQAMAGKF